VTGPLDEGPHQAAGDERWREAWEVDLVAGDGRLAAELSLCVWPADDRSECRVSVVGEGRRLLTVVEHQAPPPPPTRLGLRTEGLWLDLVCETPLVHWTVVLEAFGVLLDDPLDAFSGCRGDRTPVGLDVEWVSQGGPHRVSGGYELGCVVAGEVLVGTEVLEVDGHGWRRHAWGVAPPEADRAWGHTASGTPWAAPAAVTRGPDGLPASARATPEGRPPLDLVPRHHAPAAQADGSRAGRSLCEARDGARSAGLAWLSWSG
jgi:hypothetical protein